jgi:hypothetical protein
LRGIQNRCAVSYPGDDVIAIEVFDGRSWDEIVSGDGVISHASHNCPYRPCLSK